MTEPAARRRRARRRGQSRRIALRGVARRPDGRHRRVRAARRDRARSSFVHTEVLPGAEGMGVGRGLARAALDDVRRRGLKLVAECEFIAGFLKRHPEDRDLLAD